MEMIDAKLIQESLAPEVDFHVHLFPDDMARAVWKAFKRDYDLRIRHRLYHRECIDFLHAQGVKWMVFSNYSHRQGFAKELNHWNVSVLDEYAKLYCFLAYHPSDEDGPQQIEKLLAHDRVLGVKLNLMVQKFPLDDPRLFPLYELMQERGKRMLLHVGTAPVAADFLGLDRLENILRRFPRLKANIAHMGGREYERMLRLLDEYESLYVDTAYVFIKDSPWGFDLDPSWLERYRDRILYGSDFPNLPVPHDEEINQLKSLGLSNQFYSKIFRDNGKTLLERESRL